MEIGKTLYVSTRSAWRRWLAAHHASEKEIWLIYYKKDSGKPRISYDDSVLEALAYGWIDSTVKKIDAARFAQRFSPRKPTSQLSQMNRERIGELIKKGKMTKAGLEALKHVYDPRTDRQEKFSVPPAILAAIKSNPDAWANFRKMPAAYRRIRIAYIESRKRHGVAMYQKSLKNFILMTAKNKRIGFVRERQ